MFRAIAGVLSLPPTLAHEATHWLVARAQTDDAALAVEVTGGQAAADLSAIENSVGRFLAYLAPTILGSLLLAVWMYADLSFEGLWLVPKYVIEFSIAAIAMPSPEDVRGAFGIQDAQNGDSNDDTDNNNGGDG